jgi:hypothetical protein
MPGRCPAGRAPPAVAPATPSAAASDVRIIPDESNNLLLIKASPSAYHASWACCAA